MYVNNYHLRSVSASISANNPSNANAYVYLCSQNNQGGVVGIAWLSATCDSTGRYRSSVNEYLGNDATTASVCNLLHIYIDNTHDIILLTLTGDILKKFQIKDNCTRNWT